MLKKKTKILFVLVAMLILISTLSFATIEPRTSSEDDIMPISENSEDGIAPISENGEDTNNQITNSEENLTSNWINSDLYLVGNKVEINQIVDGNIFVFANEVIINGEIGGNAFVFANKLTLNGGYIYSSLFATASEIIIKGVVYDLYAFSNNFTLEKEGFIYRDLKVSANTLNINGGIRRDAYLTSANYNISFENGTLIGGNLNYSSKSELDIPEGIVNGTINYNKEVVKQEHIIERISSYLFNIMNALFYTFVVILLASYLAPKFIHRVTTMNTKKAFVSFGIGALSLPIICFTLILLLFSKACFIPALALTLVYVAICMSGTAFASIYFGSLFARVIKWEGKVKFVLASLITSLIIWAISQIPYIGPLFGLLIALFGIGTLFVNAIYRKENATKEVIETKVEE